MSLPALDNLVRIGQLKAEPRNVLEVALKAQGAQCHFISRAHPGHLLDLIRQRGYKTNSLVAPVQQAQAAIKTIAESSGCLKQRQLTPDA